MPVPSGVLDTTRTLSAAFIGGKKRSNDKRVSVEVDCGPRSNRSRRIHEVALCLVQRIYNEASSGDSREANCVPYSKLQEMGK